MFERFLRAVRPLRRSRILRAAIVPILVTGLLAACQTTPTAPPKVDLPVASAGDLRLEQWWADFGDHALTALIDEAIAHNLDLQAALARIESARAEVKLASADLYPSLGLGVGASRSRVSEVGSLPIPANLATSSDFSVGLSASYEVDLWGKYRASTRAAKSDLLASEYARETVRSVVAAQVARTYFNLVAADAELTLLEDTLALREQSLALQTDRERAGIIGDYDLAQAKAERDAVVSDVAVAGRAVGDYESALAVLIGRSPRDVYAPKVIRTPSLVNLVSVPSIPAGIPSNMLLRRPDVRAVEKQLAAASLRIDAARADYFPSLDLTGSLGSESAALSKLFSGPAAIWSIGAALAQPLIGLQAIEANVEAQKARRHELVVAYEQTVQSAFKDAHDALVEDTSARASLAAQATRTENLRNAYALSDMRYRAGYSPYLEVLDAQRQLLQAQTLEIVAARNVRLALVDLAQALGGGWDYRHAVE